MDDENTNNHDSFPIVALCSSAGGLEAFQTFFGAMPAGSGIAFVVMQHQAPHYESILSDILKRYTEIPVTLIEDGMPLQPDCVYVCPSSDEVNLEGGRFQLVPRDGTDAGWPRTIDRLLKSLAHDQGERMVAAILSGAGTDGVEGARAVVSNGGRVIAQEPSTALHSTMPEGVIEQGLVEVVLPLERMPYYLSDVLGRPFPKLADYAAAITDADLEYVVKRLRRQTGRDFTDYKTSTMRRQIARRLSQTQMATVDDYLDYMHEHPEEAEDLIRYLLIHVTSFFRDPQAFDALKEQAIMPLLREMDADIIFRVWVAGCASGEEAVSIAILIYECLRDLDMNEMEVRIFATDASYDLIRKARSGYYPSSIAEHITKERLRENFFQEKDGYRVRNHIMQMIIWSEHNLVEHPPFSKLHLISCRNVLIYFQQQLQERVMSLFQFALRENGVLFLGTSETVPFPSDAFVPVNRKQKIYRKTARGFNDWLQLDRPLFKPMKWEVSMPDQQPSTDDNLPEIQLIREMLIEHFNATCLIVDESYYLLFSYGEVDRYLSLVPGKNTQTSVLNMAREGLDIELTIALHEAFEHSNKTVRRSRVWVRTNGAERIINLTIKPINDQELNNSTKLVIIESLLQGKDLRDTDQPIENEADESNTIAELQQELKETKEALRATTQALQAKSEELTTSIEEVRSANEEVQTTNEELRTSKEELATMNEELNTLNTQLTDQNEELSRANDTLHNFLQSVEIGMVILDQNMVLREFTRAATQFFRLRSEDRGRPLADLTHGLDYDELLDDAKHVLDTLENIEKEVQTTGEQKWLTVRMRPYRTTSNMIDGVVITIVDVTSQKQAQHEAERQTDYMLQVFDTLAESLIELDSNLRVIAVNTAFYQTFHVNRDETTGYLLYELGNGQWDIPELRRLLQEIIPEKSVVLDYEVTHDFPDIGQRTMRLNARQIAEHDRILLVITDVSASG